MLSLVVLFQAEMPGNAGTSRDGAKLMDNVPGNEIYVIVVESEFGVADTFTTELVEFGFLHPLTTL